MHGIELTPGTALRIICTSRIRDRQCAQRSETQKFTPNRATKSLEITSFARMPNLGLTQALPNGFSGTSRVSSDLRMVQDSRLK